MAGPGAYRFEFSGGALALDFANTVSARSRPGSDHFHDWPDLLAWAGQARLVVPREAARLGRAARRNPDRARRQFNRAVALRETLYHVFSALAAGRTPPAADVERLNLALGGVLRHARLDRCGQDFVWAWVAGPPSLDRVLWPVLRSAADLLVSDERARVRECASETCTWLFVDRSRTHERRWCSMRSCGNRAKARRFQARQRGLTQRSRADRPDRATGSVP